MEQEQQRLRALYRDLGDAQLMKLAQEQDGLREAAREAVAAEMAERGLTLEVEEPLVAASLPALGEAEDDPTLVDLFTFQIAKDAQTALEALDEAGVPVRMEPAMRRMVEGGPRIKTNWLSIFVERERQQDAVKVLREKMGLFPVQEKEGDEGPEEGEEGLFTVGEFDLAADAAVAAKALTEAGIFFQETKMDEGEITVTVLEARLEDLERAQTVVEAAFLDGE